jgi:hypothetical protein
MTFALWLVCAAVFVAWRSFEWVPGTAGAAACAGLVVAALAVVWRDMGRQG